MTHLLPYLRYFFENTPLRCPVINTAYNTVILPSFMVWKFCGKSLFPHSFKLCLSKKFPEQEIRWNYGILHSVIQRVFYIFLNIVVVTSKQIQVRYPWRCFQFFFTKLLSFFYLTTTWKGSIFGAFLVLISLYLDWIRRDKKYPNAGKYRPEKSRIRTPLTQWSSFGKE